MVNKTTNGHDRVVRVSKVTKGITHEVFTQVQAIVSGFDLLLVRTNKIGKKNKKEVINIFGFSKKYQTHKSNKKTKHR